MGHSLSIHMTPPGYLVPEASDDPATRGKLISSLNPTRIVVTLFANDFSWKSYFKNTKKFFFICILYVAFRGGKKNFFCPALRASKFGPVPCKLPNFGEIYEFRVRSCPFLRFLDPQKSCFLGLIFCPPAGPPQKPPPQERTLIWYMSPGVWGRISQKKRGSI